MKNSYKKSGYMIEFHDTRFSHWTQSRTADCLIFQTIVAKNLIFSFLACATLNRLIFIYNRPKGTHRMCKVFASRLPSRLAIALLTVFLCLPNAQATEFVLTTAAEAPYHRPDQTGLMNQLVGEAFRRVGIEARIVLMPGERALQTANAGNVDGDAFRIMGLHKQYSNLVPTTESIFDMKFSAFTLTPMSTDNGWDDISKLRIGIVRGYKILEFQSQGMNVTLLNDQISMFNMLMAERIDVALTSQQIGMDALRKNGINDLVLNDPPIVVMPLFIYLHNKHSDLVPALTQAVKDMKADGTHQRIVNNFR